MRVKNSQEWLETLKDAIDGVKCKTGNIRASFNDTADVMKKLFKAAIIHKHSIFWVGNGGSAGICSHLSQDMMNKLGIKSYCFNDPSLMTCMTNDYGYKNVYARPLALYASENDILIAISSSGNSENILNAVEAANKKNMRIITLSGFKGDNKLWNSNSDTSFLIISDLFGIVEVSHEALLHGVIETLWLEIM